MTHTCYALDTAQLQRLLGLLSGRAHLFPDVREIARESWEHVVAAGQVELGHLVLVVVPGLLGLVRGGVDLLAREPQHVGEAAGGQRALAVHLAEGHVHLARHVRLQLLGLDDEHLLQLLLVRRSCYHRHVLQHCRRERVLDLVLQHDVLLEDVLHHRDDVLGLGLRQLEDGRRLEQGAELLHLRDLQ